MAELSREELQRIVEEKMPGWTLAEQAGLAAADVAPDAADADTPSLAALRRKYLGSAAAAPDDAERPRLAADDDPPGEPADTAIVIVERKDPPRDPYDRGAGPKAVVIADGEIIGRQG